MVVVLGAADRLVVVLVEDVVHVQAQIQDATFQSWLAQVPNPVLTCEYRAMFQPGFEEKLCDYLGVPVSPLGDAARPRMARPLTPKGERQAARMAANTSSG